MGRRQFRFSSEEFLARVFTPTVPRTSTRLGADVFPDAALLDVLVDHLSGTVQILIEDRGPALPEGSLPDEESL